MINREEFLFTVMELAEDCLDCPLSIAVFKNATRFFDEDITLSTATQHSQMLSPKLLEVLVRTSLSVVLRVINKKEAKRQVVEYVECLTYGHGTDYSDFNFNAMIRMVQELRANAEVQSPNENNIFTSEKTYSMEKDIGNEDDRLEPKLQVRCGRLLSKTIRNLVNIAAQRLEAHKSPDALCPPPLRNVLERNANKKLYQLNKVLASANAVMEAKLAFMRTTLRSLTTKIEDKTGEKADTSDTVEHVSRAIRLLLLSHFEESGENKENHSAEVVMMSNQLQKLDGANEALQNEVVGLQDQLKELRQQKKKK